MMTAQHVHFRLSIFIIDLTQSVTQHARLELLKISFFYFICPSESRKWYIEVEMGHEISPWAIFLPFIDTQTCYAKNFPEIVAKKFNKI